MVAAAMAFKLVEYDTDETSKYFEHTKQLFVNMGFCAEHKDLDTFPFVLRVLSTNDFEDMFGVEALAPFKNIRRIVQACQLLRLFINPNVVATAPANRQRSANPHSAPAAACRTPMNRR